MTKAATHEITARPNAGRLDSYLAEIDLDLSRSRIKKLIQDGLVLVDGMTVRPSCKLKGGEAVWVKIPPPEKLSAEPEELPVELIYEDDSIVVVSKPQGLVVHPAPGHPSGTLVNALLHKCKNLSGIGGVLRPGIVHRLDKDTSGVLVVAKNDGTHHSLQEQFKGRSVKKTYLALVLGRMPQSGVIDRPIGRSPKNRKAMAIDAPRAREATTKWEALQFLSGATLVEIDLLTGRTHQIRVHLASLGHPIIGDSVYQGVNRARGVADRKLRDRLARETKQALHSWKLEFDHPRTGERMKFRAPIPEAMLALIADLGGDTGQCR